MAGTNAADAVGGEFADGPAVSALGGVAPATLHRHAFLVGCPRSGTTLLERMLGSHPQLASSSESAVWHSAVWMPFLREAPALQACVQC